MCRPENFWVKASRSCLCRALLSLLLLLLLLFLLLSAPMGATNNYIHNLASTFLLAVLSLFALSIISLCTLYAQISMLADILYL